VTSCQPEKRQLRGPRPLPLSLDQATTEHKALEHPPPPPTHPHSFSPHIAAWDLDRCMVSAYSQYLLLRQMHDVAWGKGDHKG
jgi:hypothetical protein